MHREKLGEAGVAESDKGLTQYLELRRHLQHRPQEDGTSPGTQMEHCQAKAEWRGGIVVEEFVWADIRSGEDPESGMLDSMLSAVHLRLLDAVVVHNSDRLSRDPLHHLILVRDFQDEGVLLEFFDGKDEDTPEGCLVLYVQVYAGQTERLQIAERAMRGKGAAARFGRLPCGTGAGIYGCGLDPITGFRTISEVEAQVVKMIFLWFAKGAPKHPIACRLNGKNVPNKKGFQWYPLTVLRNRTYTGVQNYGEYRHRKVKSGKIEVDPRPESEVIGIEGFTPQIIVLVVFEPMQERLDSPQARKTGAEKEYLLTGRTKCPCAGAPLSGRP